MRKSFKREKLQQQQQQQPHPALDFSIPKKKRGSGDKFIMIKKARQQQQSLLLGKKTTMVMTITHQGSTWVFNKSHNDDHMLSREQVLKRERLPMVLQEQEEENNVKQTRKKIKGSDGLARRSEFEEELSDGAEEWVQVTSPKRLSGAPTGNKKKLKKKKKKKSGSSGVRVCSTEIPNPSRELPDEFKRRISEMGGTNITLVMTKRLTDTDCREQEQRLSMPFTKIRAPDFLEGSEKDHLQGRDESGKKNGKSVWLIQPNHEDIEINLRRWDMPKKESPGGGSSMYVLVKPWNDVVRENGLKSGDAIQVWSFREGDNELRLALVKLPQ